MRKGRKSFVAAFLAIAMVLSLFTCITVRAEEGEPAASSDGSQLPRIGVYTSDVASEETLVCSIDEWLEYEPGKAYYLIANDELKNDKNMTPIASISLAQGVPFSVTGLNSWEFQSESWKFNLKGDTTGMYKEAISISLHNNATQENEIHHVNLIPKSVGLVVSETEGYTFVQEADKYSKSLQLDMSTPKRVSIGILSGSNVNYASNDGLSILDENGNEYDREKWEIEKVDDSTGVVNGVYDVAVKEPGKYIMQNEHGRVNITVEYPDIAFVSKAGTYWAGDTSIGINDRPATDYLFDDENNQLFEKDFYIGTLTEPEGIDADTRIKNVINSVDIIKNNQAVVPARGYKCEIAVDGSYASVYLSLDALKDAMPDDKFGVVLRVGYTKYTLEGNAENSVVGEESKEKLLEIYTGADERNILKYSDFEGAWVGDGFDTTNNYFEYDGENKAIEKSLTDEVTAQVVDVTYKLQKKNEEGAYVDVDNCSEIGEYRTTATYNIKEDYKTAYKIDHYSIGFIKDWKIVRPVAVIDLEVMIEENIPDNPENLTTEAQDEVTVNALDQIVACYTKLNEAQKTIVNEEAVEKMNTAATAVNNYADAVNKIDELPDEITVDDEESVKAAREAFDKLTDTQKKITNKLNSSELKLKYAELLLKEAKREEAEKKEAEDKKAAEEVEELIYNLPSEAGVSDEEAVKAARAAYDALSADQKKLIDSSVLKKLENAEASLAKAKKAAEEEAKKPKYSNEWINGRWYNKDGICDYDGILSWQSNATGWWVEDTAGWYPVSSWQKIDGVWYYFNASGYMASKEYYNGYWFNSDGSWDEQYFLTWKSNATGWWVEDISGWWPSSSWLKIDGYWYYFDASGYMVTSQYVDGWWISADGICY